MENQLEIRDLKTYFYTDDGVVKAVDGVDLTIGKGEAVGLVGESGCGKSVTSLSVMRLVQTPPGKIIGGEIWFTGRNGTRTNLLQLAEPEMRKIRGAEISMIFQEPMTSLNPVYTIGNQIAEAVTLHKGLKGKAAIADAVRMLKAVQIPDPEQRVREYPHQLSGGMRQRVMIAMALSCDPLLLIADEPTTALDVTIQAQILDLLADLKRRYELSLLLITHSLGVVAEVADKIAVMYAGRIVEQGTAVQVFKQPKHPYTMGLLRSVPRIDAVASGRKEKLATIEGTVPDLTNLPLGCSFQERCPHVRADCRVAPIELIDTGEGQLARCVLYRRPEAGTP